MEIRECATFPAVHTVAEAEVEQEVKRFWTIVKIFAGVNCYCQLHLGVRRTWLKANKRFAGQPMRYELVVRHLKVPNLKKRIVMDNLIVTPVDMNGNDHILMIVNHFS